MEEEDYEWEILHEIENTQIIKQHHSPTPKFTSPLPKFTSPLMQREPFSLKRTPIADYSLRPKKRLTSDLTSVFISYLTIGSFSFF
jgi:hypothetical protein